MTHIYRHLENHIQETLNRGQSILLLGPRQTGKTTLIKKLKPDLYLSLLQPKTRLLYEKNPNRLLEEVESLHDAKLSSTTHSLPLIIIDEIQKNPELLDSVQLLIDDEKAQFLLTGSSARKLRHKTVNWLPGRIIILRLDPILLSEWKIEPKPKLCTDEFLLELLLYGSLPRILKTINPKHRTEDLRSYVITYLEEEIRQEAIVRKIGVFSRFLELAAAESGKIVNFSKLSQEIGVAHTTIASYYEILEDCLIAERIEPLTFSNTRRRLIKSPRYLFFDLGVRRVAAQEGIDLPRENLGHCLESWVGLELLRILRLKCLYAKLNFWRDVDTGAEIDWIITSAQLWIPIEVKWDTDPDRSKIKHLQFLKSLYPDKIKTSYIVCRTPRRAKIAEHIYALPWFELDSIFSDHPEILS
ncbi:MAG: ATP-binding protein [Gammaproteobacteria bacterium]